MGASEETSESGTGVLAWGTGRDNKTNRRQAVFLELLNRCQFNWVRDDMGTSPLGMGLRSPTHFTLANGQPLKDY